MTPAEKYNKLRSVWIGITDSLLVALDNELPGDSQKAALSSWSGQSCTRYRSAKQRPAHEIDCSYGSTETPDTSISLNRMCHPHRALNYPNSPRHGHYRGRFQWWRSALRPGMLPSGVRTWGPLIIRTRQHGAQLTPQLSPAKLPRTAVTTPSSLVRHW